MDGCQGRCVCGAEVVLLTSWTKENPGRRFLRCVIAKKGSMSGTRHYFAWFDKPMPVRAKVVINGLLRKLDDHEKAMGGGSSVVHEADSKLSGMRFEDYDEKVGNSGILERKSCRSEMSDRRSTWLIFVCIAFGIAIGKLL